MRDTSKHVEVTISLRDHCVYAVAQLPPPKAFEAFGELDPSQSNHDEAPSLFRPSKDLAGPGPGIRGAVVLTDLLIES